MQVTFVYLLLAALTNQAFATIFITSPTLSSTGQGGQSLAVVWKEDGNAPTLATVGLCDIGLFAGNQQQQTEVQHIASAVDVSKQNSQNFTVDPTIGPNYDKYFIRFTSISLKDPSQPQFPYEAFSAQFRLDSMTGQFNATVQAQTSGITSGSGAAATSTATSASITSAKGLTTTSGSLLPASAPTSSSSSAPKSTQSKSAASTTRGNVGILSAIGIMAGLVGLTM